VGGDLPVPEDEQAVVQALAPTEETWTALQQYLAGITGDDTRVAKIKSEILFRMAKGEERYDRNVTPKVTQLKKYVAAIQPDVNARGENGVTALMVAAANDRGFHVHHLLQAGANPNLQNEMGETAVMWAAAYGAITPIRHFREQTGVQNKIPVDFNLTDNLGWNALMVAAWCGNYAAAQLLTNRTSNKSQRDVHGFTAAALVRDPASPAVARTTPEENIVGYILGELQEGQHPLQGGRKRTYRSKTKDKKRGTR
jgi:ankyrin repeat protein